MFTWGPHPAERRAQRRPTKARNLIPGLVVVTFILGFSIMPVVCAMRDASSNHAPPAAPIALDLVPIPASAPAPAGALPLCPGTGSGALLAGGYCVCSAAATASGVLWGSGPYTTDSSPCRAARHAGALGPDGGVARFVSAPGQPSYQGTVSHGVTSSPWTSYPSSFVVERIPDQPAAAVATAGSGAGPGVTIDTAGGVQISASDGVTVSHTDAAGVTRTFTGAAAAGALAGMTGSGAVGSAAPPACPPHLPVSSGAEPSKLTCACAAPIAAAPVWGDRRYALDSGVCAAALHAEAISTAGGPVTLWILPGCDQYVGARRAGITSRAGDATDASFTFDVGVESSGLAGAPACPRAGRAGLATPAAP